MDRDRLQDVQRTDITESRVNEEFVDWLKNKGPSWLLIILVFIIAYLVVVKFRTAAAREDLQAWSDYSQASRAPHFDDVAENYPDKTGLFLLSKLNAADLYLHRVQTGFEEQGGVTGETDADGNPIEAAPERDPIDNERRAELLDWSTERYQAALDEANKNPQLAIFSVNALSGLAAVAEARSVTADTPDEATQFIEQAKNYYNQAAAKAETVDAALAQRMRDRADHLPEPGDSIVLPTEEELRTWTIDIPKPTRVQLDPSLRDILLDVKGDDADN
jgi:hypothetical protein